MFKPYDRYKETNIPWMKEIPEHWEVQRIGMLFLERKTKVSDKEYLPLSVTKKGIVSQLDSAAKSDDGDNRKMVLEGDFVINSRSDRKGSSGISSLTGSVSLINIVLEPRAANNSYFMHHLLKSDSFVEEYYRNGRGIVADLWTTRFSEMKTIMLPVPPRYEQDQIVHFLDWQLSKINKLIKAKQKQIALLNEQKQAVINKAVTKGLDDTVPMKDSGIAWVGEIPAEWNVTRIKNIVTIYNEKTTDNHQFYLGMENIQSWSGKYIATEKIIPEGVSNKYKQNCLLFGKLRPYLAKVFLTENSGICSSEFLVFDEIMCDIVFLKYALLSPKLIDAINSSTYGAKMPRANWNFISNCCIAIPENSKQKQIVDFLDGYISATDATTEKIQAEIELISEYKTSLISSVVTGKVDVRDVVVPNFEVEEELMEDETEPTDEIEA